MKQKFSPKSKHNNIDKSEQMFYNVIHFKRKGTY